MFATCLLLSVLVDMEASALADDPTVLTRSAVPSEDPCP